MQTEKTSETKDSVNTPNPNRSPPPMPDNRSPGDINVFWIQTAHKYTITFELICHCLELCGLRKETVSMNIEMTFLIGWIICNAELIENISSISGPNSI